MTTPTLAEQVAVWSAHLAAAERDLDRADELGDTAAVVRIRASLEPRIVQLRGGIAKAKRLRPTTTEANR